MAFLLCHFCLLRGQSIRTLELADIFEQPLKDEGYSECVALVLLLNSGKTNQFGKFHHVGFFRNTEVEKVV